MRVRITIESTQHGTLTFEQESTRGSSESVLSGLLGQTVAAARRAYQLDGPEADIARLQGTIDEVHKNARQHAEMFGPEAKSISPQRVSEWLSAARQ